MSDATVDTYEQFLTMLDGIPWCKQGDAVLVAVHKGVPEVLDVMKEHEARVFPGNINVKVNKSTLHEFREKHEEGRPVPVLLVWKPEVVEIWFRTHKSEEFPYDTWSDAKAAAYEKECITIPTSQLGDKSKQCHKQHIASSKACPAMIPPL
jgi:hypothetical protein